MRRFHIEVFADFQKWDEKIFTYFWEYVAFIVD